MFVKIKNVVYNVDQIKYIRKEKHTSDEFWNGSKYTYQTGYYLRIVWSDNTSSLLYYDKPEEAKEDLKKLVGDIHD